jgi:hypothetical protein
MRKTVVASAAIGAIVCFASFGASASTWIVSYESEQPGMEHTTATFSVSGVETFDSLPVGLSSGPIDTSFGTNGTITGVYTGSGSGGGNVQINPADIWGGAGGAGNYIVAFGNTPYTLTLTSSVSGGINYFGYWLSARGLSP